ncbi:MFS transporter [uncultured Desulfosarcina sp.]|uniref:MFS transporter n=1 Tax=uncultured Desulfosarcina sp. TaxID=218289 RepID=UPI0029C92A45|nr:MFS transporter [uncultured Desulfosarcina sp.]
MPTSSRQTAAKSPFAVNNVRMFIAFRVFFNCRFYYPIFTVLFLDFGLSVAQFSILNAVWAATIVMAEVPSGALADIVGRRRLLVFAAMSMLVEMAILCLAPRGSIPLLFGFFCVNRVLSGLAEAAASGADEAIAYDALQAEGMADQWGRVLEVQMRLQSVMFILTMSAGAAVYDPELMTRVMAWLGSGVRFTQDQTLRLPLYLTFLFSLVTLAATWRLDEIHPDSGQEDAAEKGLGGSTLDALKLTFSTGGWILKTPFVLAVILFGMLFDGVLRMAITLASQYYRMVQLPESLFGILGSVMAVAGLFIPRLARRIAENHSPAVCLGATSLVALSGLTGMAFFWPTVGLVPALVAFSALYMVGFFLSYFVNREAPSSRRATVLSFKGLAYNLSYGLIGVVYAGLLEAKKAGIGGAVDARTVENLVFKETFFWFPVSLAAGLVVLIVGMLLLRARRA